MSSTSRNSILLTILSLWTFLNINIANAATLKDVKVEYINPDFVDLNTFNFTLERNRDISTMNIRFDIIKDLPSDIYVKVSAATRAFGHVIPTGIAVESNICSGEELKALLDVVLKPVGITDCPPPKGKYAADDIVIDLSSLKTPIKGDIEVTIEGFVDGDVKLAKATAYLSG